MNASSTLERAHAGLLAWLRDRAAEVRYADLAQSRDRRPTWALS